MKRLYVWPDSGSRGGRGDGELSVASGKQAFLDCVRQAGVSLVGILPRAFARQPKWPTELRSEFGGVARCCATHAELCRFNAQVSTTCFRRSHNHLAISKRLVRRNSQLARDTTYWVKNSHVTGEGSCSNGTIPIISTAVKSVSLL